jgi:hypothetical protein
MQVKTSDGRKTDMTASATRLIGTYILGKASPDARQMLGRRQVIPILTWCLPISQRGMRLLRSSQ